MQFARPANRLLKDEESARENHVLAGNFAKYSPILKLFTHRLSNKPFLIWSLTIPPHLKFAATLLCNLSLRTCFADINVLQCSVATYARCGGIFNTHLTAILPRNLPVKFRLRFDRIMVMSLWPRFFGPPCTMYMYNDDVSHKMPLTGGDEITTHLKGQMLQTPNFGSVNRLSKAKRVKCYNFL